MAYTIKRGDTLSALAKQNNTTIADIMKANPSITDPNKIIAGRTLNFNAPASRTLATDTGGAPMDISNKVQGVNAPPTTANPDTPDANAMFFNAMVSLLKNYQSLGTKSIQSQGLDLQSLQTNRVSAEATPGFSPNQQSQIRSASAGALDPSIQGNAQQAKTMSEQIGGLGDVINNVKGLFTEYTNSQNKARDDARSLIQNSFTQFGGDAFSKLALEDLSQLEKRAGLPKGYLSGVSQTIKERELAIKQQQAAALQAQRDIANSLKTSKLDTSVQTINGKKVLINNQTGEVIKELGSATPEVTDPQIIAIRDQIDTMLSPENQGALAGITGPIDQYTGGLLGGKGALLKNQYEQVKNFLSIENRQKLKGQGAVSDFEGKMLASSATALGRNLDEADFRAELQKIRDVLDHKIVDPNAGVGNTVIVISPDGQEGTIPKNQLQDALKQGYKQK